MNCNLPIYNNMLIWIENARANNVSWESILNGYNANNVEAFLANMKTNSFWPDLTTSEWKELVDFVKGREDMRNAIEQSSTAAIITDVHQDNTLYVPGNRNTAWQCYKRRLLEEKIYNSDNVREIENSCIKTLRCLSRTTDVDNPRKGMVVGNVQSGKTGHMAGLMAMAADWGWNMFIVMSGSIESLRVQTEGRLVEDLSNNKSRFTWIPLPRPNRNGNIGIGFALQHINLNEDSTVRYLTVCLKNSVRLDNLLDWLHSDPNNRRNLKVLVIDDEADQASINTNEGSRTVINNALINMVNGCTKNGRRTDGFACMNYVAYTATPYANLLSEAGMESLYPKDFITSLSTPKEYFGPQQIFGIPCGDYDGMDIIRTISDAEVRTVAGIADMDDKLPTELEKAICWYLCGVSCFRYWRLVKPVSMLIHTSMRTTHHEALANYITKWFTNNEIDIIVEKCRSLWEQETSRFTLQDFADQYPDYSIPINKIRNYPHFEDIKGYLSALLSTDLSQIPIDKEGNPQYHEGIHLCVDNSTSVANDVSERIRLLYPKKEKLESMQVAPAFIVIGGNTLSRGLTIEGLISTYFIRVVRQADTLMQMGRWFGYRYGYELLPRIWMQEETQDKFAYLSKLDQELRTEIRNLERSGATPRDYAVRLLNSPSYIRITAANRMRGAEEADMDFSGTLLQTFVFDENQIVLRHNLQVLEGLMQRLNSPETYNSYSKDSLIWRDVQFDLIEDFLSEYQFCNSLRGFNEISSLMDWLKEVSMNGLLENWNIVFCGKSQSDREPYRIVNTSYVVNKITRSRKKNVVGGFINIGVLTSPADFIADLDMDRESSEVKNAISTSPATESRNIRSMSKLKKCPQLLLYVIDKNSKAKDCRRDDLNAPEDIVGVAINIPGHTDVRGHVRTVRIRLNNASIIDFTTTETEE